MTFSNAAIVPTVYFFYPETAYRSLEEMDSIFQKTRSVFTVVSVARKEPNRYGKNGELLINYEETEEHRRRSSATYGGGNIRAATNIEIEEKGAA